MFGCLINCVRMEIFFRLFIIIESAVIHNGMKKRFDLPEKTVRLRSSLDAETLIYRVLVIILYTSIENVDDNGFLVIYTSFLSNRFFFHAFTEGPNSVDLFFCFRHLFGYFIMVEVNEC